MPRPNKPRALAAEEHLARRIAFEREAREMSYEGLAKRMTDVGCPINASALFKVEKGSPRRRITYAEAVALANVFDVSLADLAVPPELLADREVVTALERWSRAGDALGQAAAAEAEAREHLRDLLSANPDVIPAAAHYLGGYASKKWGYDGERLDEAVDYLLLTLRGLPKDSPEWRSHFEKYVTTEGRRRGKH